MDFIKLYDWIADTDLDLEQRVIFALINQFSEESKENKGEGGFGFWGGYKTMSARTGIPKLKCRRITEDLIEKGIVIKTNGTMFRKTRIFLRSNPAFVKDYRF